MVGHSRVVVAEPTAGPFSSGPSCLFRVTVDGWTGRHRRQTDTAPSWGEASSFGFIQHHIQERPSLDTLSHVAGLSHKWNSYNHWSLLHLSHLISPSSEPQAFSGKTWDIFHQKTQKSCKGFGGNENLNQEGLSATALFS